MSALAALIPGRDLSESGERTLMKPLAWAGQGASTAKQMSDLSVQFIADGLAWIASFIQVVWTWTSGQIVKMSESPWESWPLWKQIVLILVAAAVVYALYLAARQLWWAAVNVLSALASFIGTLIVTLPAIMLAGAIALAGLWVINNFHGLSSLRSIVDHGDESPHGSAAPPGQATRHDPTETFGGR